MKLSLPAALYLAVVASATENDSILDQCQKSLPTVDLSGAFMPLNKPAKYLPDENGVTKVKLFYDVVDYVGASFTTIVRTFNGGLPGPTLHVVPGGSLELELINCLHSPVGFDGPDEHNRYHHPNATK